MPEKSLPMARKKYETVKRAKINKDGQEKIAMQKKNLQT